MSSWVVPIFLESSRTALPSQSTQNSCPRMVRSFVCEHEICFYIPILRFDMNRRCFTQ